jgi:hypothetical protein
VIARIATWSVAIVAALAWAGVAWVVVTFPPAHALAQASFYALLFVALAGSITFVAWTAGRSTGEDGARSSSLRHVGHAMLFSSLVLFGLWLQSLRMLTLLNAALLLAVFAFLELTLLVGQRAGEE